MLRTVAAEFADPKLGVSTCPYRAVPGRSFWSTLEAIGMNTEFLAGVLVARMLEGMKFALGPTLSARKQVIEQVGGWPLSERVPRRRFRARQSRLRKGWTVLLSSYVVEHHIGDSRSSQCASPTALVSQHPPLAARGLCRPAIHKPTAVGVACRRMLARFLARAPDNRRIPRASRLRDSWTGTARHDSHFAAGISFPFRTCSALFFGSPGFSETLSRGAAASTACYRMVGFSSSGKFSPGRTPVQSDVPKVI